MTANGKALAKNNFCRQCITLIVCVFSHGIVLLAHRIYISVARRVSVDLTPSFTCYSLTIFRRIAASRDDCNEIFTSVFYYRY